MTSRDASSLELRVSITLALDEVKALAFLAEFNHDQIANALGHAISERFTDDHKDGLLSFLHGAKALRGHVNRFNSAVHEFEGAR